MNNKSNFTRNRTAHISGRKLFAAGLLAFTTLAIPMATYSEILFTKVTDNAVAVETAHSIAAGWVDFDGDGDLDLFVTSPEGSNVLYSNDGKGSFTKVSTSPVVNAGPNSYAAAWADLNNDGRLDLYLAKDGGPSRLFVQQANGDFTQSSLPTATISGAAWADYDGDGFLDLLSADNSAGMLWHNNGRGGLTFVTSKPINVPGVGVTTWADYDGDGDMDALVVAGAFRSGTTTRLFRNEGHGAFTPITTGAFAAQKIPFTAAVWSDYDNDGLLDVFLPRYVSGQIVSSFLFHNQGNGEFVTVDDSPVSTDLGSALGGSWADYDNDGWLDLFVSDTGGGNNRLYHNNGDGTFTAILDEPIVNEGGTSASGTWGDYDGDGFLDLFVSNSVSTGSQPEDFLYHNRGNSNAWIEVKCVGTRSNRSAIGAKVRLKATIGGKTFWQLREINSGNGWTQNAFAAHFGLGNATNVQILRIEWPSGTVQELSNLPARQSLTVTEPSRLVATGAGSQGQFTLEGGRDLSYQILTSANLRDWSLLNTVTITNLNGAALITDTNAPTNGARYYRAVLQ